MSPEEMFPVSPRMRAEVAWYKRVRITVPDAPSWFMVAISRVLASPAMSSDALLILADALYEGAGTASQTGSPLLAAQLRELAELPRALAPGRAKS